MKLITIINLPIRKLDTGYVVENVLYGYTIQILPQYGPISCKNAMKASKQIIKNILYGKHEANGKWNNKFTNPHGRKKTLWNHSKSSTSAILSDSFI